MNKFNKYLTEFLMIFLAVVLGFIAENFRENIGERSKEKEYVRWLIKDLQTDTVILHRNLKKCESVISATDSMIALLTAVGQNENPKIVSLYQTTVSSVFFNEFHKYAVVQLRNSEHAGLIRSMRVNDLIARFEYSDSRKANKEKFVDSQREKLIDLGIQIFDNRKMDIFLKSENRSTTYFVAEKERLINQFIGQVRFQNFLVSDLLQGYRLELLRFESTIQTIAKEYDITQQEMDEIWDLAVKNSTMK
jgi:hypothetical protein